MITRKMTAVAALPVAALLAGGGVAAAQVGAPAGAAVYQQVAAHHGDGQSHKHRAGPAGTGVMRHDGDHGRHGRCDREHAGHRQAARAGGGLTVRAHCHGHHGDE